MNRVRVQVQIDIRSTRRTRRVRVVVEVVIISRSSNPIGKGRVGWRRKSKKRDAIGQLLVVGQKWLVFLPLISLHFHRGLHLLLLNMPQCLPEEKRSSLSLNPSIIRIVWLLSKKEIK